MLEAFRLAVLIIMAQMFVIIRKKFISRVAQIYIWLGLLMSFEELRETESVRWRDRERERESRVVT